MNTSKFFKRLSINTLKIIIFILLIIEPPVSPQEVNFLALAVDTSPPDITITSPENNLLTNNSTVVVDGLTEPTTNVEVFIDDNLIGNVTSNDIGYWTLTANNVSEGSHTLYAHGTDAAANVGFSNIVNFSVDKTPPIISITKPSDNTYTNSKIVEGYSEPNLNVDLHINQDVVSVQADSTGHWQYADNNIIMEGSNLISATTVDNAGNIGNSNIVNFTFDDIRPIVSTNLIPPEDMTRVSLDITIKVIIMDSSPLNISNINESITLSDKGINIPGTIEYNPDSREISFKPSVNLNPNTRYFVKVNPFLVDLAGNFIYPRSWEFTSMGMSLVENPHGNYANNVNTCINCHSTHRATGRNLDKSKYSLGQQMDNYCNACHDGTSAPIPNNWLAENKHNAHVNPTGTAGAGACVSCHNPHLTWEQSNPNALQDYFSYNHNDPTNPFLPNSSDVQLCESCHDGSIKDDSRVQYNLYNYKKSNSATGIVEDYSLCLRCHDGSKAVDIASYYNLNSRHRVVALDGSELNGYLPCSDCHNTHGSNNIKLLRTIFGQKNETNFIATGTTIDAETERVFCTRCHNNSTELYGIKVLLNASITGHEDNNPDPCSKCHGGTLIKAAHGSPDH